MTAPFPNPKNPDHAGEKRNATEIMHAYLGTGLEVLSDKGGWGVSTVLCCTVLYLTIASKLDYGMLY